MKKGDLEATVLLKKDDVSLVLWTFVGEKPVTLCVSSPDGIFGIVITQSEFEKIKAVVDSRFVNCDKK